MPAIEVRTTGVEVRTQDEFDAAIQLGDKAICVSGNFAMTAGRGQVDLLAGTRLDVWGFRQRDRVRRGRRDRVCLGKRDRARRGQRDRARRGQSGRVRLGQRNRLRLGQRIRSSFFGAQDYSERACRYHAAWRRKIR